MKGNEMKWTKRKRSKSSPSNPQYIFQYKFQPIVPNTFTNKESVAQEDYLLYLLPLNCLGRVINHVPTLRRSTTPTRAQVRRQSKSWSRLVSPPQHSWLWIRIGSMSARNKPARFPSSRFLLTNAPHQALIKMNRPASIFGKARWIPL